MLLGIQEELPGVHVQISFLPTMNAKEFVSELIDDSLTAKARDGFILVRTPHDVQQLICDRGVPGVVYGALYPGITRLTRFDRDMSAVGELAANSGVHVQRTLDAPNGSVISRCTNDANGSPLTSSTTICATV